MPTITLAQDITPSTQLMFPSSSQAEAVQSPATTQTFGPPSTLCSAALPPSVGSRQVRTIAKPQPKRRLKPEGSSLSEHIKNRDLQWLKAQQRAAAQPDMLVLLNDVPGVPAAEKSKPSRMSGRIYPRPPPSELMTTNQPSAAEIIYRLSTFAQAPAPVDVKQPNEEKIMPAVTDIAMSDPQPENMPRGSEIHPSALMKPPVTPSGHVGVKGHGGEFSPCPVITPQVNFSRFGGKMAVMIYRRGLGSVRETLDITFNLDDLRYSHIARWAKLKRTKSFLTSDKPAPCFEILMHSPCSWPTSGNLSLQTKRDGKDFIIPLASPIFVTPNNCVDVSSFIRSGENTFSVVQQNDMSDYLFVFHAHYPTPQQLDYVASCRHRREEWVKSISGVCKLEPKE
ncbi:hypothetical protein BDR05DRAFT_950229 [Suillus weaverae]|nr:hypothetical protein BDR05DRAFT_950229 [Suillus weaverae]